MNTTIDVPLGLSNLLSAYDNAHWEVVVAELKPASGILKRGSVLSAVALDAGKLTLTTAGSEAGPKPRRRLGLLRTSEQL
jgi:hypothetical protein